MTTTRRRRWFRDETVAPWVTVAVIGSLWWVGATLVGNGGYWMTPSESVAASAATGATGVPLRSAEGAEAGAAEDTARTSDDATIGAPSAGAAPASLRAADLPSGLVIPVEGVQARELSSTFHQDRGGNRRHEAMDILAPRGTPVLAAVDGRVAKLFTSVAGGLTIYQFDEDERFSYYYAHLDRYAPGLNEGREVKRGTVIGYVGTTGNAPANTPHLHFAVFKLGPDRRWWEGEPIDPFALFRH